MKSIGERISEQISELSDIEVLKLKVEFAIFNNKASESYKEKIDLIEKNFESQATFYGKKEEDYINEKNEILDKYNKEFQKIYDARKNQFYNIVNEISEMQANQKIAFINMNQVVKERDLCLKSQEYIEYEKNKKEFETKIKETLVSAEYDKYTNLLKDLKNPLDTYYTKLVALTEKYDNYQSIIDECEKKLVECTNSIEEDFNEIVKFRNSSMVSAKKGNPISNIINKIVNVFAGKGKYEKEVVLKMNNELNTIAELDNSTVEIIESQTVFLVSKVEELREETNKRFKLAIG